MKCGAQEENCRKLFIGGGGLVAHSHAERFFESFHWQRGTYHLTVPVQSLVTI